MSSSTRRGGEERSKDRFVVMSFQVQGAVVRNGVKTGS